MATFEAELEKAIPDIRYFARSLTKDPHNADDLTQDVLEKAIINRDNFRGGNIAAWLMTMTRNTFIDQHRSRKRKPETAYDPDQDTRTSDDSIDDRSSVGDISNAIGRLAQSCREVLSLIGIGYKYAEIAGIVGTERGTVMSRLSRCRKKLAEII